MFSKLAFVGRGATTTQCSSSGRFVFMVEPNTEIFVRVLMTSCSSSNIYQQNAIRNTTAGMFSTEIEYQKEIKDIELDYGERQKRVMSKIGEVVSVKMSKTVNVMVYRQKFYPKYNKYVQARRKIMAHDENEVGKLGDIVRIATHRPMSKMKRHYLIDVIRYSIL